MQMSANQAEFRAEGVAEISATLEADFKKIVLDFQGDPEDVIAALAAYAADWVHNYDDFITADLERPAPGPSLN